MAKIFSRRQALLMGSGALASASLPARVLAKPKKKIGVALVGLGRYSTGILAPALQLTEHCELRGIVTGSPSKIPQWQKQYGIKDANVYNYDNMHQVANNKDIDVIYIVLPTFLHKKYSVIAANAGKHVWCEKPMAMNVEECEDIIKACDKNKVKLSIGYRLQHEPNTQTLISYADTKPFGDIKTLTSKAGYSGRGTSQDNWRMDRSKGGGAIYDMGVYPINAARYATGLEPIAVSAKWGRHLPEVFKKADDTCYFELEFKNGIKADCETSVVNPSNILQVNCEKGWYKLEPMQSYSGVQGERSDGVKLDKYIPNQQARQMDDDALAILNNTPVMVPGSEGLLDIKVVLAAIESANANSKRIKI